MEPYFSKYLKQSIDASFTHKIDKPMIGTDKEEHVFFELALYSRNFDSECVTVLQNDFNR